MALSKLSSFSTVNLQRPIPQWRCLITSSISSASPSSMSVPFPPNLQRLNLSVPTSPNSLRNRISLASTYIRVIRKLGNVSFSSATRTQYMHTLCSQIPKVDSNISSLEIFKWVSPVDTYFPAIRKLGIDGNIQEMEILCSEMVKGELPFSEGQVLEKLIDPFVNNGKFDAALKVLHIMILESGINFPDVVYLHSHTDSSDSSFSRLNDAIRYLCRCGRMELAFIQFDKMSHKDVKSFEIIIIAVCWKKMVDECIMLLDQLFQWLKSTGGTPPQCVDFYANVLQFMTKANEPDKVSQVLTLMTALEIPHHMMQASSDCEASIDMLYDETVKGFCNLCRFDDAAKFVEEHVSPCPGYANDLLKSYCNFGMFDEANDYLEKLVKRDLSNIDSWTILIRALCAENAIDKAFETLKRMITYWDQQHARATQTSNVKDSLIRAGFCYFLLRRGSHSQNAHDMIMSEALDSIYNCDQTLSLAMHTMLVSGLWKEGHKCEAVELDGNCGKHVAELPYASQQGT